MSCSEELLLDYSAGRLDAERIATLKAHLQGCPACRGAIQSHDAVWRAMDAWNAPPVSADFDRRLYERIGNEVGWWQTVLRRFRALLAFRAVPAAAGAAALLLACFLLMTPGSNPVAPAPDAAAVETVAPDQAESALIEMETIREFSSLMHSEAGSPRM